MGLVDSGGGNAGRGRLRSGGSRYPSGSRGLAPPPYILLHFLNFVSTVAHSPPSRSPKFSPSSSAPAARYWSQFFSSGPHWALQAAERHANRTRGQQKPLS